MQCGTMATIHQDEPATTDIWSWGKHEQDADQDAGFLQPHKPDWQQRCILSPEQVARALASQNIELQRRNQPSSGSNDRDTFHKDEILGDITPVSAPPQIASTTLPKTNIQIVAGENLALVLQDNELASLLTDPETYKTEGTHSRDAVVTPTSSPPESNLLTMDDLPLGILPCGPLSREQDESNAHILHLKMQAPSAKFYQNRLCHIMPYAPFSQAVSNGILTTALTPPRTKRRRNLHLPDMTSTSDDDDSSVASARLEINYRQGPASLPVRLLVTGDPFLDLSLTGCLGLIDDRKKLGKHGHVPFPENYLVLMNSRTGAPVAVCALRSASTGPPIMRIYATKNRVFGQKAVAKTSSLGLDWYPSKALYPWAEVASEGRYPKPTKYSIYMAYGSEGCFESEPSYRALQDPNGGPTIRMVGRTERENNYSGCATLSLCRDENALGLNNTFWKVSVSEGIDPAMLICFAAFCDETIEKTMRLQCEIGPK